MEMRPAEFMGEVALELTVKLLALERVALTRRRPTFEEDAASDLEAHKEGFADQGYLKRKHCLSCEETCLFPTTKILHSNF